MPLNEKGNKIMASMRKQYGDRAEEVFYASRNKGTISGVDPESSEKKKPPRSKPFSRLPNWKGK